VPHFLRIGSLLALVTIFFGWFGVVLFPTETQTFQKTSAQWPSEGDLYFPNLREGMWNLLVLMSTANYPDVALPAYWRSRWSMLFFIAYLLIAMFFMMNLLLATVYNVYQDEEAARAKFVEDNRRANLQAAFDLVKSTSHGATGVDPVALRAVFAELNQHRDIRYIDDERSELLLRALEEDPTTPTGSHSLKKIDYAGFVRICSLIELDDLDVSEDESLLFLPGRATLGRFVNSPTFEYAVDALVFVNAVAVAVQTRDEVFGKTSRRSEHSGGLFWEVLETGLALFYLAEMCVKLYALGFKRYFKFKRNQLDAAVAVASTVTTFVVFYPNAYSDTTLIRYVLVVRLARLVRVLEAIPDFQVIGEAFLKMLPAASRLLKFLFCATFVAATLGMALFGGAINTGPNLDKLKDTDFYASGYAPLNFNDMWSAYVTLFAVLVVNNWQVLVEGYVAVAGVNARLFFIAFYCLGTLICVNLAVAFVIDAFSVEFDKTKKHQQEERLKASQRRDAAKSPGVRRSLSVDRPTTAAETP